MADAVLEEILRTGRADGRSVLLDDNAVPAEVGYFLRDMIRRVEPKTCIEIGLAYGVSALFVRGVLDAGARYIAIDPFQHSDFAGVGLANLRRAGDSPRMPVRTDEPGLSVCRVRPGVFGRRTAGAGAIPAA